MKKEEYEAHKKDYKNNGISLGAYILIQDMYIVALESKLEELMKHKTCEGCIHNKDGIFKTQCDICFRIKTDKYEPKA